MFTPGTRHVPARHVPPGRPRRPHGDCRGLPARGRRQPRSLARARPRAEDRRPGRRRAPRPPRPRPPARRPAARPITERAALAELVEDLADFFERDRDDPWIPDYPEAMLDAIVGFRLPVERLDAKFKLSQNRGAADRAGVVAALDAGGDGERAV